MYGISIGNHVNTNAIKGLFCTTSDECNVKEFSEITCFLNRQLLNKFPNNY